MTTIQRLDLTEFLRPNRDVKLKTIKATEKYAFYHLKKNAKYSILLEYMLHIIN